MTSLEIGCERFFKSRQQTDESAADQRRPQIRNEKRRLRRPSSIAGLVTRFRLPCRLPITNPVISDPELERRIRSRTDTKSALRDDGTAIDGIVRIVPTKKPKSRRARRLAPPPCARLTFHLHQAGKYATAKRSTSMATPPVCPTLRGSSGLRFRFRRFLDRLHRWSFL
jgi:hypothetical protein